MLATSACPARGACQCATCRRSEAHGARRAGRGRCESGRCDGDSDERFEAADRDGALMAFVVAATSQSEFERGDHWHFQNTDLIQRA